MNLFNVKRFDRLHLICCVVILLIEFNNVFCNILTNSYLVEFNQGIDRSLADQIARRNGFINVGPVSDTNKNIFF